MHTTTPQKETPTGGGNPTAGHAKTHRRGIVPVTGQTVQALTMSSQGNRAISEHQWNGSSRSEP
jgi:hypothetical protein